MCHLLCHQLFLLMMMNGTDIMQLHHRSMISTNEKRKPQVPFDVILMLYRNVMLYKLIHLH